MIADFNHILIFKTNIQTQRDKQRVQTILDARSAILQWNIDLHDVDCVLRIVSDTLTPEQIISTIRQLGYECAELE